MKTIASVLGVTSATVSYALRGSSKVSPAIRERVQAEAARQGYAINPLIATWMGRVRGAASRADLPLVAYVTGFSREFHANIPHLGELARGVERQARFLGFPLKFFYDAGAGVSWEDLARQFAAGRVSGIILAPFPEGGSVQLPWAQFSLVSIGYSAHRPPLHTIMDEHLFDTRATLEALVRRGARRIGMVTSRTHESRFSHARSATYLSWQQGLPPTERIPIIRVKFTRSEATTRMLEWIRRHRLDMVIGPYSKALILGRQTKLSGELYIQLGLSPGDPDFSKVRGTVDQNLEMGMLAMQALAGLLYRHETGLPREPVEISIGGALILTKADRRAFHKQRSQPLPPHASSAHVTLRDIARAMGVSPSTVSLALRNDPRIAAKTCDRVKRTARSLGYAHNPFVDAWANLYHETHRHAGQRLAHVSGFSENAYRTNAILKEMRAHIVERATEFMATVEPFHTGPEGLSTERLRGILQARGIDAVLWGPFPPEAAMRDPDWQHAIMVGLGDSPATRSLKRVIFSRYLSMRSLMLRLFEAGYQKPGLAGFGPAGEPDIRGWVPAYLQVQSTRPMRHRVPWLPLEELAHNPFDAWFNRYRPDVVLSSFTTLRERSTDTAFVAIDPDPDPLPPDLAAVLYPAASMGRGAVDLLIADADLGQRGRPADPSQTAYRGTFRPGPSCPGFHGKLV